MRVGGIQSPFHERAYYFVLAALEFCQQRRSSRGHISGEELARACRDFAIDQYGLLARTVLAHWGITSTEDFGEIVYGLIEAGLLVGNDSDRKDDFAAVFDFEEEFEIRYPWLGVPREPSQELNHRGSSA